MSDNTHNAILSATRELLEEIAVRNAIEVEEITSVFFTVTEDLNAVHPALAARQMGWQQVPLLCAREIPVPGGLGGCVRVLLHVNTTKRQSEIQHVYLREAASLRPEFTVAAGVSEA